MPQQPNTSFWGDDPRSQRLQHQFYQQQTMQGSSPTIPPVPQKKPSAWQRFKASRKSTKVGVGCGTILFVLLLCLCSTVAYAGWSPVPLATVPTATAATATSAITHIATSQPTAIPTRKPTITPTTAPTQAPVATATQPPTRTGVNGNPWGYDFNPGNLIYNPPAEFCTYFACIASFWKNTNGYVDECVDGMYSHSGGVTGACSRHGGESKILYSH